MDRAIPSINKHLKRKEEERNRGFHLDHLKNIRPITSGDQYYQPIINNKKKQLIMENRFTEIERENRILLQKITGIMGKKRVNSSQIPSKQASAIQQKSLNVTFRKKRFQQIEIQNAKLLKRLQEKKSEYEAEKMKKDWNKKKYVIRNISSYPLAIFDKDKKKSISRLPHDPWNSNQVYQEDFNHYNLNQIQANNFQNRWQMTKIKLIDGHTFSVTIRFDDQKLIVIADEQVGGSKQAKVIEISREQALEFIIHECQNKIQRLFERLKYDGETLYLVGEQLNEQTSNDINQIYNREEYNKYKVIQDKLNNKRIESNQHEDLQEKDEQQEEEEEEKRQGNIQSNRVNIKEKEQDINYNPNKFATNLEQQYQQENFGELLEQQVIKKNNEG